MDGTATFEGSTSSKGHQGIPSLPTLITERATKVGKNKRKRNAPEPPTRQKPKWSKPGKRELQRRKTELTEKLSNSYNSRPGVADPSSYTNEDFKRDKSELEDAIAVFGSKIKEQGHEAGLANKLYQVKGMAVTLRDYQVVGTAFMIRKERERNHYRGDILADQMGIGKTVQAIACMVANPPKKKAMKSGRLGTLIIVPSQGLASQWAKELETKAGIDSDREILTYSGKQKIAPRAIAGYPFIVTTYSQVQRDFKLHESEKKKDIGALFEVEFYRIVLDEGDNIKNCNGGTTKACIALKGVVRWVLSGTPLRNRFQECLPYLSFLGIDDTEKDRALQILAIRMIRRDVGQIFMGREMCKLPPTHYDDRFIALARAHLSMVLDMRVDEARGNKDYKPRVGRRQKWLRQRQAAEHPYLLESCFRDYYRPREIDDLILKLEECCHDKPGKSEDSLSTRTADLQQHDIGLDRLAGDMVFHLRGLLASSGLNLVCEECFQNNQVTELQCRHIICQECYESNTVTEFKMETESNIKTESNMETESDKETERGQEDRTLCPICSGTVARLERMDGKPCNNTVLSESPVKLEQEVYRPSDWPQRIAVPVGKKTERSLGKDYNGTKPQLREEGPARTKRCKNYKSPKWLAECEEAKGMAPSTKTTAALSIIKESQAKAPDDKIIVFVEWITSSTILGSLLNDVGIPFVYYNGAVSIPAREKNYDTFKTNPKVKVMIASLAAGNVGLNLTEANLVINMSPCVMAKTKETRFVRIFAKNAIDNKIYDLQQQKLEDIKDAMVEGRKPKPFTAEEWEYLSACHFETDDQDDDSDAEDDDEDDDPDYRDN
ncbi:P-loop containing nucleoside triphosphate hydrolase protein [Xylariaceae sp. FL0594]|nr:P-loop containing nucleoside triphosphate hydrolase protein [Xylariaceae sp. FL0594]